MTRTHNQTYTALIGDEERRLQRPSGRKASQAFAIIRAAGGAVPELVAAWGEFKAAYGDTHYREYDRGQAMLRYGPAPLLDPFDEPVRYPDTTEVDGELHPHPRAGEVVMVPGPLDGMTEEAWDKLGHTIKVREPASVGEAVAHIFPRALELCEEHIYALLALFTMDNADVKKHWRDGGHELVNEKVREAANDLLDDAYGDELLELAVVCGELVDGHFVQKAREIGERAGKALRLVGIDLSKAKAQTTAGTAQTSGQDSETSSPPPTSPDTPASSTPTRSTDGPESSDGESTPPSTPPSTSSPDSELEPAASGT